MDATFRVHIDLTDRQAVVWWAETTSVPGLTLAADTLMELRRLIDDAVGEYFDGSTTVSLELVPLEISDNESPTQGPILGDTEEKAVGPTVRKAVLYAA